MAKEQRSWVKNQLHRVSRGGSDPDIPESCVRDCKAREDRLLVFKAAHSLESMNMSQEYTRQRRTWWQKELGCQQGIFQVKSLCWVEPEQICVLISREGRQERGRGGCIMVEPGSKRSYFIDFEGGKTAMSQGIFKASRSWIKPGDAFSTRSSRRSPAMLTSWFQLRETCASGKLELQPKQSKYLAFSRP